MNIAGIYFSSPSLPAPGLGKSRMYISTMDSVIKLAEPGNELTCETADINASDAKKAAIIMWRECSGTNGVMKMHDAWSKNCCSI